MAKRNVVKKRGAVSKTASLVLLPFAPKKKSIAPVCITAAASIISSAIANKGKGKKASRRQNEGKSFVPKSNCTKTTLLVGAGSAVAGAAAGYFAARTLQLKKQYGNPDNDFYTKNPKLSDYAPSPAPRITKKDYVPFDKESMISVDGTTQIAKA